MSLIVDNIRSEGYLSGNTFYAITAEITNLSVTNITGASTTDYYVTGGTFSAGTLTLNRNGLSAVTITGFTTGGGSGTLTGTGITDKVAFWTDSSGLSATTNFSWDSANERLGVGISSPTEKLHISGNTIITGIISGQTFTITSTPTNNNNNTRILSRNSTTGNIESVTGVTFGSGTNQYVASWNSTSGLTNSSIRDNGNTVTIGGVSPSTYSTTLLAVIPSSLPTTATYGIQAVGGGIGIEGSVSNDGDAWGVRGIATPYDLGGGNHYGGYFEATGGDTNIGVYAQSVQYAARLQDNSVGVGKFLYSVDSLGSTNWTSNLSGTSAIINGILTVTGNTSLQSFTGTSGTINGNLIGASFTISSTPTNNNNNTEIITRNSSTGNIEYSTAASTAFYPYGIGFAQSIGNYLT